MRDAVQGVPSMTVSAEQIETIAYGRFLDLNGTAIADCEELAALNSAGELVAILPRGVRASLAPS